MSAAFSAPDDFDRHDIRFRIRFTVAESRAAEFLRMLQDEYLPAVSAQVGFASARVLVPFAPAVSEEIGAVTSPGVYELEFDFASESQRRTWVAQSIHDRLWRRAVELSAAQEWSGFFAVADASSTKSARSTNEE